jgi:hypothetical protein
MYSFVMYMIFSSVHVDITAAYFIFTIYTTKAGPFHFTFTIFAVLPPNIYVALLCYGFLRPCSFFVMYVRSNTLTLQWLRDLLFCSFPFRFSLTTLFQTNTSKYRFSSLSLLPFIRSIMEIFPLDTRKSNSGDMFGL